MKSNYDEGLFYLEWPGETFKEVILKMRPEGLKWPVKEDVMVSVKAMRQERVRRWFGNTQKKAWK